VEKSVKYKILETELQVSPRQYKGNCIKALFKEKASYPYVWNGCYSRRFLAKNKLHFDDELRFGEDMLFLFQVFPNVSNIVYIPDKLYQYRCDRKGSLMEEAEKNKVWKIQIIVKIVRKILKYWQEKEIIEANMDELYNWCLYFFLIQFNTDKLAQYYVRELARDYEQLLQEYGLHFTKKINSGRKFEIELKKICCILTLRKMRHLIFDIVNY
jgi:hypothetical protein